MIISDQFKFAFVHIPKCAGTAVRQLLVRFDDRRGMYKMPLREQSGLGLLDFGHIPLFVLRDYFPHEFLNLRRYWSFAVVRDPVSRFPSSLSQRFKMYGAQPIQNQNVKAIKEEIDRAINYLSSVPGPNNLLPVEYIHFQKQIDYVYLGNDEIIDTLYQVNDIGSLIADVEKRIGHTLNSDENEGSVRTNRSVVYRSNAMRTLVEFVRPGVRPVTRALPKGVKHGIREMVFVPRDRRLKKLFSSEYVWDFIRDYYRDDIALFESVAENRNGDGALG